MENFFVGDDFFGDLDDYIGYLDEEVEELDDDWAVEAFESSLEPIFQLSANWITQNIDEERFPEEGDQYERIVKLLKTHINFDSINAAIPKLYYQTNKKFTITKADLLNYLKP